MDKKLYSDLKLADGIKLGKTKMESIVKNVLSPYSTENVTQNLIKDDIPFSIATYASNKGSRKCFSLAVRYFDENS